MAKKKSEEESVRDKVKSRVLHNDEPRGLYR
jgi:hypothetical protein